MNSLRIFGKMNRSERKRTSHVITCHLATRKETGSETCLHHLHIVRVWTGLYKRSAPLVVGIPTLVVNPFPNMKL
jgi:hypothetical protein